MLHTAPRMVRQRNFRESSVTARDATNQQRRVDKMLERPSCLRSTTVYQNSVQINSLVYTAEKRIPELRQPQEGQE